MLSFYGDTLNITKPTLCRVVYPESSLSEHPSNFILCAEYPNNYDLYSGIILKSKSEIPKSASVQVFRLHGNNISLNEGDILFIQPSGIATILYNSKSSSNSILLTEKCNCRCIMCPQPPKQKDAENLADLAISCIELMPSDTKYIGITGGEPTMVWTELIKVLNACNQFIPSAKIQLLTNGQILSNYYKTQELVEIGGNNLFACVSIYSDVEDIHDDIVGLKGAFWNTIEGLYNLARTGILIELRTVINKFNYMRLSKFAEFIYRTMPFVGCVALMAIEPVGLAYQNIGKLWIDPVDYIFQLEKAVRILHRRDIKVYLYNHQLCTLPASLWTISCKSISDWKVIYMKECEKCKNKLNCGGFFHSAITYKSRGISAIC